MAEQEGNNTSTPHGDLITKLLKQLMLPRAQWDTEAIGRLAENVQEILLIDVESIGKAIAVGLASGELDTHDAAHLGWTVSMLASFSSTCRMLASWTSGEPLEGLSAADTLAAGLGVRGSRTLSIS